MATFALVLVGIASGLHTVFMLLETFLWESRWGGSKILRMTPDQVKASLPLAKNQGLYNGFLAIGMASLLFGPTMSDTLGLYCLSCGVLAGIFGAITVKTTFLWIQAIPSAAALMFYCLSKSAL